MSSPIDGINFFVATRNYPQDGEGAYFDLDEWLSYSEDMEDSQLLSTDGEIGPFEVKFFAPDKGLDALSWVWQGKPRDLILKHHNRPSRESEKKDRKIPALHGDPDFLIGFQCSESPDKSMLCRAKELPSYFARLYKEGVYKQSPSYLVKWFSKTNEEAAKQWVEGKSK